jgi:hypothetical protein
MSSASNIILFFLPRCGKIVLICSLIDKEIQAGEISFLNIILEKCA